MQLTKTNLQEKLGSEKLLLNLSLGRITFLSFDDKKILQKKLDSPRALALMSIEEIFQATGNSQKKTVCWNGEKNLHEAQLAAFRCKTMGIKVVDHSDEKYPELLRQIEDPPFLLFCRGNIDILTERSVSVVGTRRLSPTGKKSAHDFAYDAVKDGCNVVSGLANGADGWAHQGAIDAYFDADASDDDCGQIGHTIAVLPSAIDDIVPANHRKMAGQIIQTGGCLISEYEPGTVTAKWHFVARNRLIAGLSPATVVVEAPAGSGALITADFATDYNRDVMFHKSTFCDFAKQIAVSSKEELEKKFCEGTVSKYKMGNTPEKYLLSGAFVVEDYKDYCKALTEIPGKRNNQIVEYIQQSFFEEK